MIYVFAYAFPHRKTQDFLLELKLSAIHDVYVIAAPWKKLSDKSSEITVRNNLQKPKPQDTETICKHIGFKYSEIEHENLLAISELIKFDNAPLAIISGARILKKDIIDLFSAGIVNFHPGKLPETAGLDAFFYAIKKSIPMGVTVHFINHLIDAGQQILFKELKISKYDTVEDVSNNLYYLQIKALRCFLNIYKAGGIETSEIVRPKKNAPMMDSIKIKMLENFDDWRNRTTQTQLGENLLLACKESNLMEINVILEQETDLIEYKNAEGWTPLIVAAFNQNIEAVKLLIGLGADPRAQNVNGTTVLMYAKTQLLKERQPDFSMLHILLESGADISAKDKHGKTVVDYCAGNLSLLTFFQEHSK